MLVGIDEVGRGCWAGPVVAGAVVLDAPIAGLRDSKLLTARRRQSLAMEIEVSAAAFGIGWVDAAELDAIGLSAAVGLAMRRALSAISLPYGKVIVDGSYNFLADLHDTQAIIKADQTVPEVSAASIIAKVKRDAYMQAQDTLYPGYGFSRHVGYGTAEHGLALARLGPCTLHRRSFAPVRAAFGAT